MPKQITTKTPTRNRSTDLSVPTNIRVGQRLVDKTRRTLLARCLKLLTGMRKTEKTMVEQYLPFCDTYAELYRLTKKYDAFEQSVRTLNERLGLDDNAAKRARLVAGHIDLIRRLLKARVVPALRSVIVELCEAEAGCEGTLEQWWKDGKLREDLTIPEIRVLKGQQRSLQIRSQASSGNGDVASDTQVVDPNEEVVLDVEVILRRCDSIQDVNDILESFREIVRALDGTINATNYAAIANRFNPHKKTTDNES